MQLCRYLRTLSSLYDAAEILTFFKVEHLSLSKHEYLNWTLLVAHRVCYISRMYLSRQGEPLVAVTGLVLMPVAAGVVGQHLFF
jgi:hypothetical protein